MTHYRPIWLLAAVLLVGAAACTDTGELEERVAALEERPVAVEERPVNVVVARHLQWSNGNLMLAGSYAHGFLQACREATNCTTDYVPVITVLFGTFARELYVNVDCFLAVRVGDPWPSDDACR